MYKIPVKGLSNDVTVHLIYSLTSFQYYAEQVFYFRKIQDFGCFLLYCFWQKQCISSKIFRDNFASFLTSNKKSLKCSVTCVKSFLGVDLFNVQKNECIKNDEMFSEKKKHWHHVSKITSKSLNMTNDSFRVHFSVMK